MRTPHGYAHLWNLCLLLLLLCTAAGADRAQPAEDTVHTDLGLIRGEILSTHRAFKVSGCYREAGAAPAAAQLTPSHASATVVDDARECRS